MATYAKLKLSGSTDGRGVLVAATTTPGTTIHTAHATSLDELWLWAINTDTTARLLTIEFGGTTSPGDVIQMTIPAQAGLLLMVPGCHLTNSTVVKAFCAVTNKVTLFGYVNRIT